MLLLDGAAVAPGTRVGPATVEAGSLLAADTVRRVSEVARLHLEVVGVPRGWEDLNVHPSRGAGPADVLVRGAALAGGPPYRLEHRLAWLTDGTLALAGAELAGWRGQVAQWAEEPSKPICAQVQQDLLAALQHDLDTGTAVEVLRGSLDLGLPPGCLFETWAWADRLLGLDLAADVGR
jgi:hypothetical protein